MLVEATIARCMVRELIVEGALPNLLTSDLGKPCMAPELGCVGI